MINKIAVYDIETIKGAFLACFYVPEKDEWCDFSIDRYTNDLYKMVKWMEGYVSYYWVGYNSLSFDSQVMEWVWRNHDDWVDMRGEEIAEMIWKFAQNLIDRSNYGLFAPYREEELTFKQIDLFKVCHFDNKNRMVGLKTLEFEMDLEDIEEMGVKHDKVDFTEQEVIDLVRYCRNDVHATYEFYKMVIGDTTHPLYKSVNQIELRENIKKEFTIPCMNYSDAKIGDEIIKKYYCEEKGIYYKDLPMQGFFRKKVALKHCIPNNISFKTKQLQDFLAEVKKISLRQGEDFVREIEFYGQKYTFAKGGIHNVVENKIYEGDDNTVIIDLDVGSYYPAIIINHEYYPYHLGKEFLKGYTKVYHKRLEMKPLAKKDDRVKGIVEAFKKVLNCPYGKSSDMQSWLYDRQLTLATCLTGELSLLMLVEDMEINGIPCISVNTDGATFMFDKGKMVEFERIKKEWVDKLELKVRYDLEQVQYQKIIFSTVNDYLAIKVDGEVKKKGDFLTDFEMHKNKSGKVINVALEKYFVEGKDVEDTIRGYDNMYDFCFRAKANRNFHYEGINKEKRTIYNKLIRYYISLGGEKLIKVKNEECDTNAVPVSQVNADGSLATVKNHLKKGERLDNINYQWYIDKANEMIFKVEKGRKPKAKKIDKNQISLF